MAVPWVLGLITSQKLSMYSKFISVLRKSFLWVNLIALRNNLSLTGPRLSVSVFYMTASQLICKTFKKLSTLFILLLLSLRLSAERIVVEEKKQPIVGREAAQKFFTKQPQAPSEPMTSRNLSLHVGGYLNSKSYYWGKKSVTERPGYQSVGVTYKIGEWPRAMDLSLRIDYLQYSFLEKNPIKLSILPLFTFPDSATHFPLYFGAGIGGGVFLTQLEKESNLALDYQLVFGFRMQDLWGQSGFFIESGIKDHLHLLSDGQFTGQFLVAGAVFSL